MTNQTGPTTAKGKKRSAQNAWKHGITASLFAIQPFEDPAQWEEYRQGILASLNPVGDLEHALSERIAISLWLRRRIDHYNAVQVRAGMRMARNSLKIWGALEQGTLAAQEYPAISVDDVLVEKAARLIPEREVVIIIMRYEAHLRREIVQTLHELEAMQIRRKGGSTPLARLDITGSPNP